LKYRTNRRDRVFVALAPDYLPGTPIATGRIAETALPFSRKARTQRAKELDDEQTNSN
jgi:hypothetical protein